MSKRSKQKEEFSTNQRMQMAIVVLIAGITLILCDLCIFASTVALSFSLLFKLAAF